MKKNRPSNNHRNLLTIGGLSALCAAVLAGAFFLTREPENQFIILPQEPGSVTDTWNENTGPDILIPTVVSEEAGQVTGTAADQTQVLVSTDETGNTVDLSGSTPRAETAPETPPEGPVTNDDTTNPDKKPEYEPSVPESRPEDNPPADTPAPSKPDDGHPGQVYDPVFGWIDSGHTSQDHIDNDGDINKQIGTMGGN